MHIVLQKTSIVVTSGLLSLYLVLVSPFAEAMQIFPPTVESLIVLVICLIVLGIIFGFLWFFVERAPAKFMPPILREIIHYVMYFIVVLVIINYLLTTIGHPFLHW